MGCEYIFSTEKEIMSQIVSFFKILYCGGCPQGTRGHKQGEGALGKGHVGAPLLAML